MKSQSVTVTSGPFDPGGQPNMDSANRLQLALFAWNVQGGMSISKAVLSDAPRHRDFWQWPTSSRLLARAEEIGFDTQLQYGRWSGYGGETGWNDASLDFASAAAASAAITSELGIISTVHTGLALHPMHVAKIGASIDHISGGRWGLNVVAGINSADFRQFGITEMESGSQRYARAEEFVILLKHLWSSDEPINFEGQFYRAYDASVKPRPSWGRRPAILNAGQSPAGLDFACRQADWVFVAPPSGDIEDYARLSGEVRERAANYGRKIKVAAMCYVVMEDSDAQAAETVARLEREIDRQAIVNFLTASMDSSSTADMQTSKDAENAGLDREKYVKLGLGLTGYQVFGGYDTAAERLRALSEAGVDSAALCFWDPARGLEQMAEHVIPRLKKWKVRV